MGGLKSLIEWLEAASGPNYMLECAIWDAIYPGERDERFRKLTAKGEPYHGRLGPADKDGYIKPLRAFTASLDAALTLVPEGCELMLDWHHKRGDPPELVVHEVYIQRRSDGYTIGSGEASTIPLAICVASLNAREAQR